MHAPVRSTGIASWQAQRQEDTPARGGAARRSGKGRLAVTSPRLRLLSSVMPLALQNGWSSLGQELELAH
jgi:hypothetical protein